MAAPGRLRDAGFSIHGFGVFPGHTHSNVCFDAVLPYDCPLSEREAERRQLMEGMKQTRDQLNYAYAQFNIYTDPDLVDACVYEIYALHSRYSYYVRQVKALEAAREGTA